MAGGPSPPSGALVADPGVEQFFPNISQSPLKQPPLTYDDEGLQPVDNNEELLSLWGRLFSAATEAEDIQDDSSSSDIYRATFDQNNALGSFGKDNSNKIIRYANETAPRNRTLKETEYRPSSTKFTGRFKTNRNVQILEYVSSPLRTASPRDRELQVSPKQQKTVGEAMEKRAKHFRPTVSKTKPGCGVFPPYWIKHTRFEVLRPTLTRRNLCMLLETIDVFTNALSTVGIPYFMYGGTLIGSWRHHGIVPWDDDVDLAIPYNRREEVYRCLANLAPRFIVDRSQKERWKLYKANASRILNVNNNVNVTWRFPFLDISFYRENLSHVWDSDVGDFPEYIYPRHWIFPLLPRPFQGRWLLAPRHVKKTLDLTYNLDLCQTGRYNHREERRSAIVRYFPCADLRGLVPFVSRQNISGGCLETLSLGDRALGHHFVDQINC